MKHSEGPWTGEGPDEFGDYNIHEPGIRAVVAAVISNLRDPDEIEANARLIAAAPELLAAAERVLTGLNARIDRAVEKKAPCPVFDGIAELHDAINKARRALS